MQAQRLTLLGWQGCFLKGSFPCKSRGNCIASRVSESDNTAQRVEEQERPAFTQTKSRERVNGRNGRRRECNREMKRSESTEREDGRREQQVSIRARPWRCCCGSHDERLPRSDLPQFGRERKWLPPQDGKSASALRIVCSVSLGFQEQPCDASAQLRCVC